MGGVLNTALQMIAEGATHLGVAIDHLIESFCNELWDGYKTGEGVVEPALLAQFEPLEDALRAMGVVVWAMVDRIARFLSSKNLHLDAGQRSLAVRSRRSYRASRPQEQRRRNASGVRSKFGVEPEFIPDYLALVGDASDGYPISPA